MRTVSEIKFYQRKPKNIMEFGIEEPPPRVQNTCAPETPTPTRPPLNVYTTRKRQNVRSGPRPGFFATTSEELQSQAQDNKTSVFVAAMISTEEHRDQKIFTSCLIDLDGDKGTVANVDSGDLEKSSVIESATDSTWEDQASNSLGDCTATSNVVRRLDFTPSVDSIGENLFFSQESTSNVPLQGAFDQRTDTSFQVSASDIAMNNFFIPEKHNTNNPESQGDEQKGSQSDTMSQVELDEKVHSDEPLEPATPQLKQNFNKRSRNGADDENQRPLKKSKIKRKRHRPKIAGQGRKRKVKISPPVVKEKRKYARKSQTPSKQKEKKRKYVRRSSKTSTITTTEQQTESVVIYQPSRENYMEAMHPNDDGASEVAVTVNQKSDCVTLQSTEVSVAADQESKDIMVQSTVSDHAVNDDNVTALLDPNPDPEMISTVQPDVGEENIEGQNLLPETDNNLEVDSFNWSTLATRSGRHYRRNYPSTRNKISCQCNSSLEVICCPCNNRKIEPRFPEACKKVRMIKSKRKLKSSILLSYLGLPGGHVKRKRSHRQRRVNRVTPPTDQMCYQKPNDYQFSSLEETLQDSQFSLLEETLQDEMKPNDSQFSPLSPFEETFQDEIKEIEDQAPKHPTESPIGKEQGEVIPETYEPSMTFSLDLAQKSAEMNRMEHDLVEIPLLHLVCSQEFDDGNLVRCCTEMGSMLQDGISPECKDLQLITKSRGPKKGWRSEKVKKLISVDEIITKFKSIQICDMGAIVPYRASKRKSRKSKGPRPQVVLDKKTIQQWNLLMKIDDGEKIDDDGLSKEKEEGKQKLEEEAEILLDRIESFTSRMHVVLGDRRFKPWKGSVVDSVIGVFLTQNVTDSLSSLAYMSLASKFPLQPRSDEGASDDDLGRDDELRRDSIVGADGYFVTEPPVENENQENAPRLTEGLLLQNCCSQADVGIERNLDVQSVQNDEQLNIPGQQGNALDLIAANINKQQKSGKTTRRKKKVPVKKQRDWTSLGKEYSRQRKRAQTDSVDWEAVRQAPESEISSAIKSRGQHNIMAKKIKAVLNRMVDYHGSIDLEWLRYAKYDEVKDYLLEIKGLGLKSVECIRLLTLYHLAFPVDINVARIATRLGWVPLEPLPGNLQLHLLEEYPVMDSIQKYLMPKLIKLSQRALYELHYHMITFGKVFCTKLNPNCGACPMRAECRHLASAIASEKLCLPGGSKKGEQRSEVSRICLGNSTGVGKNVSIVYQTRGFFLESTRTCESESRTQTCEPLIEEPISPELGDIEDFEIDYGRDEEIVDDEEIPTVILSNEQVNEEEIPTIKLNNEPFMANIQYFMDKYQSELQNDTSSRAIVPFFVDVNSVPLRKLKNISRLRTEHRVYKLPDDHPILEGRRKRDRHDQSPYLLAIWSPGETPTSIQLPEKTCNSQGADLCGDENCSFCQSIREANSGTIRGTILVPCRTAMKGRFPLNGTYFQVNEVFADHETSYNPILVPRSSIGQLERRTVYSGTSPSSIFKACTLQEIQENFWKGFICVKGWDAKTEAPKPLSRRFHCAPSKVKKNQINES